MSYIGNDLATDQVFLPDGVGAVSRTIPSKLKDVVSVKDFGAVGDGVTDDTAAFSAAAKAVPAANNTSPTFAAIPAAPICRVIVPSGNYVLTSTVDTGNREVIWELDQAAIVSGYLFLNGEILRPGQRQADNHSGIRDYACTYSITGNNPDPEDGAGVTGFTSAADLATYPDRDSVGFYVSNAGPAVLVDVATASYTATTVTIAAPTTAKLRQYRRGMVIDTKHATKWSGIVDSWNADGSVITVVTGWYLSGGGGTPGTPPNGTGCVLNPFTKVWAHNANVFLNATSYANQSAGFELGTINNKSAGLITWGFDSVNLGTHKGTIGNIVRGQWEYGFYSQKSDVGFFHLGPGTPFVAQDTNSNQTYLLDSSGNLELGNVGVAGSRYIDFHSSGFNNDNDTRILSLGGSSTAGQGALILSGSLVSFESDIRPTTDNARAVGGPSLRWSVIYAATGTISTSDRRSKQQVRSLLDSEKAVATKAKGLLRAFKFNDAVEAKGTKARIHFGIIAQDLIEAFNSEGLDATDYGLFCYDEWDEQDEVKDEKGGVVLPYRPAGNRYGIRYEELLAFIISAL